MADSDSRFGDVVCDGCGAKAPSPREFVASGEQGWGVLREGEVGYWVLCPRCTGSESVRTRLLTELRQEQLSPPPITPEAIVFPAGDAKVLADTDAEDWERLTEEHTAEVDRIGRLMAWLQEVERLTTEKG